METRIFRYAVILGLAALGAACRSSTGSDASVRAAAGLYVLSTVNGAEVPTSDPSAATSGTIYLWPTGHAECTRPSRTGSSRSGIPVPPMAG